MGVKHADAKAAGVSTKPYADLCEGRLLAAQGGYGPCEEAPPHRD